MKRIGNGLNIEISPQELSKLIDHIGEMSFETATLQFVQGIVRSDHFVAYLYDSHERLTGLMAATRGHSQIARKNCLAIRRRYLRERWQPDENLHESIRRLTWDQVKDDWARREGYQRYGVLDRLSTSAKHASGFVFWMLFRDRRSGYYSPSDIKRFEGLIPLLSSIICRHAVLGRVSIPCDEVGSAMDFVRRDLAHRGTYLSPRELEVFSQMIEGKTSREIAEKYRITFNTAQTYKKRIYRKAGVTSQRQLLGQFMRARTG